jgi:hypothetical protein
MITSKSYKKGRKGPEFDRNPESHYTSADLHPAPAFNRGLKSEVDHHHQGLRGRRPTQPTNTKPHLPSHVPSPGLGAVPSPSPSPSISDPTSPPLSPTNQPRAAPRQAQARRFSPESPTRPTSAAAAAAASRYAHAQPHLRRLFRSIRPETLSDPFPPRAGPCRRRSQWRRA